MKEKLTVNKNKSTLHEHFGIDINELRLMLATVEELSKECNSWGDIVEELWAMSNDANHAVVWLVYMGYLLGRSEEKVSLERLITPKYDKSMHPT